MGTIKKSVPKSMGADLYVNILGGIISGLVLLLVGYFISTAGGMDSPDIPEPANMYVMPATALPAADTLAKPKPVKLKKKRGQDTGSGQTVFINNGKMEKVSVGNNNRIDIR